MLIWCYSGCFPSFLHCVRAVLGESKPMLSGELKDLANTFPSKSRMPHEEGRVAETQ